MIQLCFKASGNFIRDDRLRNGFKRIQSLFFLSVRLIQILLQLSQLIIKFLQIIKRLILIPPDRPADFFNLPSVGPNLIMKLPALLKCLRMAHFCPVSNGYVKSAENQHRRHIDQNQMPGLSVREQEINPAWNKKETNQHRKK